MEMTISTQECNEGETQDDSGIVLTDQQQLVMIGAGEKVLQEGGIRQQGQVGERDSTDTLLPSILQII